MKKNNPKAWLFNRARRGGESRGAWGPAPNASNDAKEPKKIAVVLFNLGGPDSPEAIRPFLRNLFRDPRIIGLPRPLREAVAWLISTRRAPKVKPLYALMGGASPILPNTRAQAEALEETLNSTHPSEQARGGEAVGFGASSAPFKNNYKVFVSMRYWHPFASETIKEIKGYAPDKIVLLPLYPQFSTTTTESSFAEWEEEAKKAGLLNRASARREAAGSGAKGPSITKICCYFSTQGLIDSEAELIRPLLAQAQENHPENPPLVLFSAHGLPQKIIDKKGDPYVWQVEQTAKAIAQALGIGHRASGSWSLSYQSRVGPVEWVKPYTDEEIKRAGEEARPVILVPIAFVSEHIETLVELDVENRHLAEQSGCPGYYRAPTVSTHPRFIEALAEEVARALNENPQRRCPQGFFACPGAASCTVS